MSIHQIIIESVFAELTSAEPSPEEAIHLHYDGSVSCGTDHASTFPSAPTTVLAYWSEAPRSLATALLNANWIHENIESLGQEAGEHGDVRLRNTCALLLEDELQIDQIVDGRWEWADQQGDWRVGTIEIWLGDWAVISAGAGGSIAIESVCETKAAADGRAKALGMEWCREAGEWDWGSDEMSPEDLIAEFFNVLVEDVLIVAGQVFVGSEALDEDQYARLGEFLEDYGI